MKAVLRMMGWILAMVVGGLVASLLWASAGRYGGGAVERVPVLQWGTSVAPVASSGELGILSWNIAYARGPAGDEAGPWSREHIVEHLDNIAQAIAALNLDVVALTSSVTATHCGSAVNAIELLSNVVFPAVPSVEIASARVPAELSAM